MNGAEIRSMYLRLCISNPLLTMPSIRDRIEHLWPILLEHTDARSLTLMTATCKGLRTACLKSLLDARERDAKRFFARLCADLGRLAPVEVDPLKEEETHTTVERRIVRFSGLPFPLLRAVAQSQLFALGPMDVTGERTVSVAQLRRGWVEITVRESHKRAGYAYRLQWSVRSNLTEVVTPHSCAAGTHYMGKLRVHFDEVWELVRSGEIATAAIGRQL